MRNAYIGACLVLSSALGYGLMPIFAKFAYKGGVGTTTLLLIRFAIAAALFFIYMLARSIKIGVSRKQLIKLFALGGVCYTGQSFLYFSAVEHIPGSLATLLTYIAPVLVAIMSFFIDKEKISVKIIAAILISFAGLAIVCKDSFGRVDYRGVLLAIGAAVVYSFYIVLGSHVVKEIPAIVSSGFLTLFTALTLGAMGLATGSISFDFEPGAWTFIMGLVLISTVFSVAAFLAGLERLGSTNASILSMTEPVFAAVFSVIFLAEKLTVYQVAGGAVVLIGAALVVKSQRKA